MCDVNKKIETKFGSGKPITKKTVSIELTHSCNLNCIHCYLPKDFKQNKKFTSVPFFNQLLNQLEKLGMKNLLFTGGEPLLHPVFDEIYLLAWKRGFIITIFTNAQLIDQDKLQLFTEYPPALIRVSLFGGTNDSYKAVTGMDGFFNAYRTIVSINDLGIRIYVKIPLLHPNKMDVIRAQAALAAKKIPTKLEARVIPLCNEDIKNLKWRLPPEEIIGMNINPEKNRLMLMRKKYKVNYHPKKYKHSLRYCIKKCQPFLVDPSGNLLLCYFLREWKVDLKEFSFDEALNKLVEIIEEQDIDYISDKCLNCRFIDNCQYCPGWAKNEIGRAGESIPFLCGLCEQYEKHYKEYIEEIAR